ncbi:hypothetical protein LEMLEM_LOCUS27835 [Lemmus lemmus]
MERGAARLCRGLPLSGRGGWRERAPDDGKRMDAMCERMDVGRGKPVTLEPPEPCLQRVRELGCSPRAQYSRQNIVQPLSGVRSRGDEVLSPGASAPSSGETKSAA